MLWLPWARGSSCMLQGENCWVFVNEDCIQDTVKQYFKFEDDLFTQAKRTAPKGVEVKPPTSLTKIVMDSKVISPQQVSNGPRLACVCSQQVWPGLPV